MPEETRPPPSPLDEAQWVRLSVDHELYVPPEEPPPEVLDPAPAVLNTRDMAWESFERLILRMARELERARDVRLFGVRGQAQHGVDLVGFFPERRPTVYQGKRVKQFPVAELDAAVDRYGQGRRPFNADRLVIAVGAPAQETAVIERLAELRELHPDLEIDLWDQNEISELLRHQPRIVEMFFGRTIAERFCGAAFHALAAVAPGPVSADAVMRGPIAAQGMADRLRDAERALAESRPDDAAGGFAAIAEALESSHFVAHAVRLREQEAAALAAAGNVGDAATARLRLGWSLIDAGDPFAAQGQVREIAAAGAGVGDSIVRATNVLSAAAGFRHDHAVTLDDLASAFDKLTRDDPFRAEAALVFAEEAIAARCPDLVAARQASLRQLADEQPATDAGHRNAARLRMCLADAVGEWGELVRTARSTYPPAVTAWVLARHARHLILTSRPEVAISRWEDAIERASQHALPEDAANWLYALRAAWIQAGALAFDRDLDDYHRLALALRASGRGAVLPQSSSPRERALAAMRDGKWPDALEALRRYLWHAVVIADWVGELEAHRRLGEVFAETGRPEFAARHFIFAGNSTDAERLGQRLPDGQFRFSASVLTEPAWERAAAYRFVTSVSDLLTDEDAVEWARIAASDILSTPRVAASPLAANPFLAAFKAFAAVSATSDAEDAAAFLDEYRSFIPRDPGTYRFTDEPHVDALIGIARAHPALLGEALTQLLDALIADQRMGDLLLAKADDLLRAEPAVVEARLRESASTKHLNAALALIAAEAGTNAVLQLARERVDAALARRVHEQGVQTFGTGLGVSAALAVVLPEADRDDFARAVLAVASDDQEPAPNRQEALVALLPIARTLSEGVRSEIYAAALAFARGEHDATVAPAGFPLSDDPLSRFRIDFGPASLRPRGLMAAAALAVNPDEYRSVQSEATELLAGADEPTANAVARALASLPPGQVEMDAVLLGTHSSASVRALAAVLWAQAATPDPALGERLARDPSPLVRSSLAANLRDVPQHDAVREILAGDARRSVRERLTRR
jgi:hypothetical protein